jgi:hypothetical protein
MAPSNHGSRPSVVSKTAFGPRVKVCTRPALAVTSRTRLHPSSIPKTITLDRRDQEKDDKQDAARSSQRRSSAQDGCDPSIASVLGWGFFLTSGPFYWGSALIRRVHYSRPATDASSRSEAAQEAEPSSIHKAAMGRVVS